MQHIHIIVDYRATESDVLVRKEIDEKLWHFISMNNMEDQSLLRDEELKDGGALISSTLARVGELAVQTHDLQIHNFFAIGTLDALR
jgi:hypothetical protein